MLTIILSTLGLSLGINIAMFLIAFKFKSDKLTDASYALSFIAVSLYDFFLSPENLYYLIAMLLVLLWAVRIGSFLLYRVLKVGKDRRFDGIREHFLSFARFWIGQAITVWILMLPLTFSAHFHQDFKLIDLIGLVVWAIGFLIETIADLEKQKFRKDPDHKSRWIDSGLWHYSRHPNYFGEILIWVGIYLYIITSLTIGYSILAAISPTVIAFLLLFVTGIPPLEKAADSKWQGNKDYLAYKARTSLIIPLPSNR